LWFEKGNKRVLKDFKVLGGNLGRRNVDQYESGGKYLKSVEAP